MADDHQSRLIAALKQRDRSVWSTVVDRHGREVYGFVFHLVGADRQVAEDLTQETWLEAVDGIGRCNVAHGSFRNWLLGIARRRVALHYRRWAGRANSTPLEEGLGTASQGDSLALPEEALEAVEQQAAVRAALLVLPDDRRQVLLWKYVDGLSVRAIAERTKKTAKAVESLLSRSREQLREVLRAYVTSPGDPGEATEESSHESSI